MTVAKMISERALKAEGIAYGFGVVVPPALMIDGEVKSVGKVLSPEEIKKLLAMTKDLIDA